LRVGLTDRRPALGISEQCLKNGDDPATMKRWLELAGPEKAPDRRADAALAELFAGAVGRREAWSKALEAFKMNESPVPREWRAEAYRKGEANSVIRVLQRRGIVLPEELSTRIRACADSKQLERWLDAAAVATTLDEFRKGAAL
jgi:hypothetical protein